MDVFFDIFEKYGWGGIIGVVLCIGIYLGGRYISTKLSNDVSSGLERVGEKLTDQMREQNNQLVNTIVTQQDKLLDHLLNQENNKVNKHNDMLNDKISLAEEINKSLKDIMNIHNSQRAFIIEFHNSSNNLSGIPFAKYSCTYEWFDKGLMPIANRCNSLPFSQMAAITNEVLHSDNQIKVYDDMEELGEKNPSLFAVLKDTRTKIVVYVAMYDKINTLIGLLVLEYQKDHNITTEELNLLSVQAAELTSIINIRYKYSDVIK